MEYCLVQVVAKYDCFPMSEFYLFIYLNGNITWTHNLEFMSENRG